MEIDLDRDWGTKLYKSLPFNDVLLTPEMIGDWESKDPFQEAGFTNYSVVAFTQTASDAVTLCTEKRQGKGLIVWDNAYNAGRGPFRSYGLVDKMNRHPKCGVDTDLIKVCPFPRHGATDFAEFWKDHRPQPGDVPFLQMLQGELVAGSVIVVEVLKNSIYNGALSAFCIHSLIDLCRKTRSVLIFDETATAFRCGRLWAFEYLDVVPDYVVFGKSLYASGICKPKRRNSRTALKKEFGMTSRHSYGVTAFIMFCILRKASLDLPIVHVKRKDLEQTICNGFWFTDFQWLGMLGAAQFHDNNARDKYVQVTLKTERELSIKFVQNEDHARFMGWVDY